MTEGKSLMALGCRAANSRQRHDHGVTKKAALLRSRMRNTTARRSDALEPAQRNRARVFGQTVTALKKCYLGFRVSYGRCCSDAPKIEVILVSGRCIKALRILLRLVRYVLLPVLRIDTL